MPVFLFLAVKRGRVQAKGGSDAKPVPPPCLSHRELIHFDSGAFSDKISGKAADSTRCTVFLFIYGSIYLLLTFFFLNMVLQQQ